MLFTGIVGKKYIKHLYSMLTTTISFRICGTLILICIQIFSIQTITTKSTVHKHTVHYTKAQNNKREGDLCVRETYVHEG